MKTRIEKMNLETLGAVERERERERVYLTNSYVNCLLKQALLNEEKSQENKINKFNTDGKRSIIQLCFLLPSFCAVKNYKKLKRLERG